MARKMIANYPNEEPLDEMLVDNYLNYMAEVMHQPLLPHPSPFQALSSSPPSPLAASRRRRRQLPRQVTKDILK
jgi:hypothetical protein